MEHADSRRRTSHRRVGANPTYRSMRRKLLIALGAIALAAPIDGFAQQSVKTTPRIAFLDPGSRDSGLYGPFLAGMKELGYVDGKNVVIEARFANGDLERLPALAKELADLKPDVILAQSTPGVRTVIATKTAAPIVMV